MAKCRLHALTHSSGPNDLGRVSPAKNPAYDLEFPAGRECELDSPIAVEPVTSGKEYKVTVLLRKNTPDGQLHGQLVIKTDDPEQESVTIPYYGIVGKLTS